MYSLLLYRAALDHYLRLAMMQRNMIPNPAAWRRGRLVVTKAGLPLSVRPGHPDDAPALADFHRRLDADDLRFRFLTAFSEVPARTIADMLDGDNETKQMLLAFGADREIIVGYALIAGDEKKTAAEIAVSVDPAFRRRGVGKALVREAERFAASKGFGLVQLIGSRDNSGIRGIERSLGYDIRTMDGDARLTVAQRKLAA